MADPDCDAADVRLLFEALGAIDAALEAPASSPDALAASLAGPVKAFSAAARHALRQGAAP